MFFIEISEPTCQEGFTFTLYVLCKISKIFWKFKRWDAMDLLSWQIWENGYLWGLKCGTSINYCYLWYAVKSFLPKEISQEWSVLVAKAQSESWCNSQSLEQVTFDQQFINISEKFALAFNILALKPSVT